MSTFKVDFYNLDNGRPQAEMEREVRAIAQYGADVLCFCEAIGYDMPGLEGYVKFRDTSRPGRENMCSYARTDRKIDKDRSRWWDLEETWTRTEHPGTHWPRSFYELVVGRIQVINLHQAPKGTDNTKAAQQEGIDLLTHRMTPGTPDGQDRPRVAVGDYNRKKGEDGPGPSMLATRVNGYVAGSRIDCAVRRKIKLTSLTYPTSCAGVPLCSDHDDMCRFIFDVDPEWFDL